LKAKIIISAIIALGLLSAWSVYPKPYNETVNGVYYQLGNEEILEDIKMHIDGKLRKPIFGDIKFEGTVAFEGEMVPRLSEDRGELDLWYERGFGMVTSYGRTGEDGVLIPDIYHYGNIYISSDFTQFTITIASRDSEDKQGSWSGTNGLMVTAPADNREEALEITNELLNDYHRDYIRVGDTFLYNSGE